MVEIKSFPFHLDALDAIKQYPKQLFYKGDISLVDKFKISIVGSRQPNQYARHKTQELVSKLTNVGVCIVSGGAIGIDAIAHKAAGASNTIMVAATGLDKRYPAINAKLIEELEHNGLVLSQFEAGTPSRKYNFVLRNEVVVALGEVLIVSYADKNSGTMRSVEYALKMGKKVYVLPHRIGESEGTNKLLEEGKAEAIYDIDAFVKMYGSSDKQESDSDEGFLLFCKSNPSYEDAVQKFSSRVFEAELQGEIVVRNGIIELA
ncbi:MAG: DNA-protecting protein DprA [Campylobacterales bacterium]|nr:DNA-protecting protein DprA [Campylobacterales bacterium]